MVTAERLDRAEYTLSVALAPYDLREFLRHVKIESDAPSIIGPVPFEPWAYLVERMESWAAGISQVNLKDRQLGFSWAGAIVDLWDAMYHGWSIAVFSIGQREAREQLSRARYVYDHLPAALQGPAIWRADDVDFGGGGSILCLPSTEHAGISYTFRRIRMDELAMHPFAHANYAAVLPTISAGGQFIATTTANPKLGPSGLLYDLYWQSKRGESGYLATFTNWMARKERDDAWLEAQRKAYIGLTEEFEAYHAETDAQAFVGKSGLMHPQFSEEVHVKPKPCEWGGCKTRVVGVDWGGRGGNPMAMVPLGVTGLGRIHQYGEFYERQVPDPLTAAAGYIADLHKRGRVDLVVYDPSEDSMGRSLAVVLALEGIRCVAANNDRRKGLGLVDFVLTNKLPDGSPIFTLGAVCKNSIAEFPLYRVKQQRDPNDKTMYATTSPVDHHGDACFIAGTLITTTRGDIPIETVLIGDLVATRHGFRPVIASGKTFQSTNVLRASLSNGRTLIGTGSHPVWVEGLGFTRLDALRYGDILSTWISERSYSMASPLEDGEGPTTIPTTVIEKEECKPSIKRYGRGHMAQSQMGAISTISTEIQRITTSETWLASQLSSTAPYTVGFQLPRVNGSTLNRFDHSQRYGTLLPKALSGTESMDELPTRSGKLASSSVSIAERRTIRSLGARMIDSVPTAASLRTDALAALMTRRVSASYATENTELTAMIKSDSVGVAVLAVTAAGYAPVYNLTVADTPEYYANGVLVHNCDARRYGIVAIFEGSVLMASQTREMEFAR